MKRKAIDTVRGILNRPGAGIALFLILASIVMSFVSPFYLTWLNWANILNQSAPLIVLAMGMTIVLMGGGVDLSVGAVAALSAGVTVWLITSAGLPLGVTLVAGILTGLVLGILNGMIITIMRIPDFVATLAMLALIRGVLFVLTQGVPLVGFSSSTYSKIGGLTRLPLGLTVPEFIAAGILVVGVFVMSRLRIASHLKATGENAELARISGVNARGVKIGTYAVSGLLAGLVGVLLAGRLGTVQPNMGAGLEISALAAAIIGGAALQGGRGSLIGGALGALTLVVIQNIINLSRVPPVFETFVVGTVIIVVIVIERLPSLSRQGTRSA